MGSVPHWLYFKNSGFCKNAAFESYGVKQSEEANMQISTGLPRPALRTMEAPEVATQSEYRLPRATYSSVASQYVTYSQQAGTW